MRIGGGGGLFLAGNIAGQYLCVMDCGEGSTVLQGFIQSDIAWRCTPLRFLAAPPSKLTAPLFTGLQFPAALLQTAKDQAPTRAAVRHTRFPPWRRAWAVLTTRHVTMRAGLGPGSPVHHGGYARSARECKLCTAQWVWSPRSADCARPGRWQQDLSFYQLTVLSVAR